MINSTIVLISVLIFLDMFMPSALMLIGSCKKDECDELTSSDFIAYKSKRAKASEKSFRKAQEISAKNYMIFGIAAISFTVAMILYIVISGVKLYIPSGLMISFDILCIILCKIITEFKLRKEEL